MPRQARVVAAGVPHHIMQRGALVAKFGNDRFDQELTPQTEEHITDIKWVKTIDIKEPMKNTYPSIKNILSIFFDTP